MAVVPAGSEGMPGNSARGLECLTSIWTGYASRQILHSPSAPVACAASAQCEGIEDVLHQVDTCGFTGGVESGVCVTAGREDYLIDPRAPSGTRHLKHVRVVAVD
jgi:hypothetical protein